LFFKTIKEEKKRMRKKEKNPYFVGGVASKSIKIDRSDRPGNNISWNDGEICPVSPGLDSDVQKKGIEIDHWKPLWV
jgi:hypothetical protein